jgi:hypothetical protein
VSRLSPSIALPLAEATRLLSTHANNTWEVDSVREADMFVRDLASTSGSLRGSDAGLDRGDMFDGLVDREIPHTATVDNTVHEDEVPSVVSEQVLPVLPSDQAIPATNIPHDQVIYVPNISQDQAGPTASSTDYYNPANPTEDSTDEGGPVVPTIP